MDTVISRKATMFRLDSQLVERLKELARAEHRSLNNFVERILSNVADNTPNSETIAAIEEAKSGKLHDETPIDTSSVEAMFKSAGL